ncbi:redoxin domain-containing protein [Candidatus Poribacteria bacterium]|nr:redoxin domain-containing protein [Candidatus Poribacteria bacterium]
MAAQYNSADFWYTLLDSLYNDGLAGDELKEINGETQEKLLAYFKTKIEEGVSDGQTALPPGLHNYFWRFSEDMLPKLKVLAEGILEMDPDNGAATAFLAMIAATCRDSEYELLLDKAVALVPKDPCINLFVIDRYRASGGYGGFSNKEKVLIALENLYKWAKQQGDTPYYRDAKSAYRRHRITPYAVYQRIKTIEPFSTLIKKCRTLLPDEQAAFQKELVQESANAWDLGDEVTKAPDFWDTYLDSLENRGLSRPWWELTSKVQEQLLDYFKARIEAGVVDGKTTLPPQLPEYVSRFPGAMRLELREFSEEVLEKQPDNGAAAKMLAIIVWEGKHIFHGRKDRDLLFLEQAMTLLPNDAETCFLAIGHYRESLDPLFELTLTTLERLFGRAKQHDESELYHWLAKLYKDVGRTPCYIYRNLMKSPEENAELLARCKPLIVEARHAFQQRLEQEPDDWYALRGLSDIYEALGETESAEKYPWTGHSEVKVAWDQTAWVGKKFPDFSAVAFDGTPISFSNYRGKMVLLNFCAKWCGFCAPEMPHIKETYEQYHKDGFDVIGVSLDENEAELREFIEAHDIPWLQIFDGKGWESELARYFGINSIPSQWLIDRDGKILSVETRGEQLGQLIKWTELTRVGKEVPDFSAVSVDGMPISLLANRGKVVILYFWTTTDYCEAELKCVDTVYQKYHDKGFEVIGVDVGGWNNEEASRNYIREKGYPGQHIYDGNEGPLAQQFSLVIERLSSVVDLPAVVLIDTDGKVIEARCGKVYSTEVWGARLEKLVAAHLSH